MRVLLTSTDNPYVTQQGGKHIHLLLLEQGLRALGLDVTTLYYNRKSCKERIKKTMLLPFPEEKKHRIKLQWMISDLKSRIPNKQFDIVHAHDVLSILATDTMPQKKVLTLHGYFARENIEFVKAEKDHKIVLPHLQELEKEGVKGADYVITVDQRLKEFATSELGYPVDRVTVMHNAVDANRFRPTTPEEQENLKKTLGFSAAQPVVLVPRRLVEKNGVIYAVRAMKNVKNKHVTMVIAGDGPERKEIAKEAEGDYRIHLKGTVPHEKIDVYYRMADIILVPSITSHGIQEASSLSMLEGMACGKVSICSNIGGMREIIQNMQNGVLVEEKEPKEIAKAIETVIGNPGLPAEIGTRAREYVLQNHSFIAHAKLVYSIYQKVLEGRKT